MNKGLRQLVENHPDLRAVAKAVGCFHSKHVSSGNNVVGSCFNAIDRDSFSRNSVVGSRFRVKLHNAGGKEA